MYFHTVLLRFDHSFDASCRARFDSYAAAVVASCSGVDHYCLRPNEAPSANGFTDALFSVFSSRNAFMAYDCSTLHSEIKDFLREHVRQLVVADGDASEVSVR